MNILEGTLIGLVLGPLIVTSAGALVCGFTRTMVMVDSPSFATAAGFGAMMSGVMFGIPAAIIGGAAGGILGMRKPRWTIGLLMALAALLGLAFAAAPLLVSPRAK